VVLHGLHDLRLPAWPRVLILDTNNQRDNYCIRPPSHKGVFI
jgi:hypothetical protein